MSEQKIVLKRNQIQFILENIKDVNILNKISNSLNHNVIFERNHPTNRFFINFNQYEKEIILDNLTFVLTDKGVNKNGEISDKGIRIEELIDLFVS